jgi:hypothetical protein
LSCGLALLVAGQVIRPGYRWLLRQCHVLMLAETRTAIDPEGFSNIERHTEHAAGWAKSDAMNKLTWIVIRKGGLVADITVGDCIELTTALQEHHFRGSAGRPLFYAALKKAGVLPAAGPERLRVLRLDGRRSIEQIVDAYAIECRPVRDLLVEYLSKRTPDLDHTSLRSVARNLCRLFWRDLELHHPGIDSLRLEPAIARAWKDRLAYIRDEDGQPVRPRVKYRSELVFVRAFYEDIARWAADDPARWAPWVAPCPIKASEVTRKKAQARGQGPDGSADPDSTAAAARVATSRRAAAQGRRRATQRCPENTRRRTVHRGRPRPPTLPGGPVRPGLRHRPGHRQATGSHASG